MLALLKISNIVAADAFFSKESFVSGVTMLGFHLVSRFRNDVSLKYMYEGPKTGKKGRPKEAFFSTDIEMSATDIMDIYRTRFQIEFLL